MSNKEPKLVDKPIYPRIIFILMCGLIAIHSINFYIPSPLTTTIMGETGWSLGQIGRFSSMYFLIYGLAIFLVPPIIDKLGLRKAALLSLLCAGIGGCLAFVAGENYTLHLIGRMIGGAGFGFYFSLPGAFITVWFAPQKQEMLQAVRGVVDFACCSAAFYLVLPIFNGTGSWQSTFGVFGIAAIVLLVIYIFALKDKPVDPAVVEKLDAPKKKQNSSLLYTLKQSWAWLLCLAILGKELTLNAFTTYFPAFLELERGFSSTQASSITGVLQFGAIAGAFLGGFIAKATGRHKLAGWPMLLCCIIGGVITIFGTSALTATIGNFIIGIGVGGGMTFYGLVPAAITKGKNPGVFAASFAMTLGFSLFLSYFVPNIFDALVSSGTSLGTCLLIFTLPCVLSLIPAFMIRETGPKGKWAQQGLDAYTIESAE